MTGQQLPSGGVPDWLQDFPFCSGRRSLDFVATLGSRGHHDIERLVSPADLRRWVVDAGFGEIDHITESALRRAIDLREAIHDVVTAASPHQHCVAAVNRAARHAPPVPQLAPNGRSLTHPAPHDVGTLLSTLSRDAIDLVTTPLLRRVRRCAGPGCTILFVDESRPGTRRWCAMERCGNRAKVDHLRKRRAATRR